MSERQEVLKGMVEDKIRLQSEATEKYYEKIFEEMRELEGKKSKEALLLVQKENILMRYQSEKDKARMLQRSGGSRVIRKERTYTTTSHLLESYRWRMTWKK